MHSLYIHIIYMVSGIVSVYLIVSQYSLHVHNMVVDTSDVVPLETIPATTSTSALSPAPTAPSETAGELTLVLKTCLYSCCVCFGLSQTTNHHSVLHAYVLSLTLCHTDQPIMCTQCLEHYSKHCIISFLLLLAVGRCQTTVKALPVACTCPQTTATVTVLSVLFSLVVTLSLSTCAVSAVVHAVMYKRLQRCRAELRGGELCSTPQLSQSLL